MKDRFEYNEAPREFAPPAPHEYSNGASYNEVNAPAAEAVQTPEVEIKTSEANISSPPPQTATMQTSTGTSNKTGTTIMTRLFSVAAAVVGVTVIGTTYVGEARTEQARFTDVAVEPNAIFMEVEVTKWSEDLQIRVSGDGLDEDYYIPVEPPDDHGEEADETADAADAQKPYIRFYEYYWGFDIGTGYNGWGNSEIQYYTDKNHKVADKVLTITAKKESMGGKQHTSSRIISKNKVHHTYGYIEARIALPLGTGMWPAFWMMPNDDYYGGWPRSGEIDIMEAKGRLPYISSSALHYTIKESNDHTYSTHEYNHETPINKYHVYAVKWEEDNIYFYVDGNLNYQANKSTWQTYSDLGNDKAPFDKDFYIILNLALGGQFDDYQNPSDSDLPAEMKIDYVRWFTK